MKEIRYHWSTDKVVFEEFEDEIVLINLRTGNYYSIRGLAKDLWRMIGIGMTLEDMVSELEKVFSQTATVISDLQAFINHLLSEGIIVLDLSRAHKDGSPWVHELSLSEYSPPILETFSDMQDLILMDPVHEVDESGWPNAKDDSPGSE